MALKFSKTSDAEHERLTVLVYGEAGIGKTSLVKTLPIKSDERVLYVAADPGQLVLRDREFVCVSWDDEDAQRPLSEILEHARGTDYDWIVVDGIDEACQMVLDRLKAAHKDGRKAYGETRDLFGRWLKAMRDLPGRNVLFLTHMASMQDDAGATSYSPSMPSAGTRDMLPPMFDLVGCMRAVRNADGKVQRMLQFRAEGGTAYLCKDRSGALEDFEAPDLGAVFEKIHGAVSANTKAAKKASKE